jgi:predicted Zn-dependent protease
MRHRLVLSVAAALALSACARNPVTGKRQLALVSQEQEIELGKQSAAEVTQSIGKYPDEKLQAYVEQVGMRMAKASERPDLPWTFTVLDDPTVNAFALPGGPVFVTRGILTYLTSEAELASVVGHEIGHITARHSVDQLSKAQLAQLGLGVEMIVSEDLLQLVFLKFGRDAERQADELGFRYMSAQGYDPREMAKVFQTLDRQSAQEGGAGKLPEWLSTHPDPGDRAEVAAQRAAKVPNAAQGRTERDAYLARVDGVVFGEDPRQGFFQGDAFLHPQLRFRIDLPEGWQKANTAAAVVAVSPKKDAAMQLSAAGKLSPEEARQKFFGQEGVKPLPVQGGALPGAASGFEAQTDQGAIRGLVSFVSHGGATYQLVGYSGAQQLEAYAAALQRSFASFGPLTDPAALSAQPAKVELVKVPREMTIAEFQAQFPSTVPATVVAIVNGVPEGGKLEAGRLAKRVVGGIVPKK